MFGMKKVLGVALVAAAACAPAFSRADDTVYVNPANDGHLVLCENCNPVTTTGTIYVGGYHQGVLKYDASAVIPEFGQALLSFAPASLPLFGKHLDIYGYTSDTVDISLADANAGTFLGTLLIPEDVKWGNVFYFDVTSFLKSAAGAFYSFNLRSDGPDNFSSLEYANPNPSQLVVTPVPEPATVAFMGLGLMVLIVITRRAGRTVKAELAA